MYGRGLILFAPIWFGAGAAIYFTLAGEPSFELLVTLGVLVMLGCAGVWLYGRRLLAMPAGMLGVSALVLLSIGFLYAAAQTHWTARHLGSLDLSTQLTGRDVSGVVSMVEKRAATTAIRLDIFDTDGRAVSLQLYSRIAALRDILPGCRLRAGVQIRAPSPPVVHNGFDARRRAFFTHVGGQGYVRKIYALACPSDYGWRAQIERVRLFVADAFRASIEDSQAGGVAVALITGMQGGINPETRRLFRDSGLAHMLAISGLHMALFAGTLYLVLRLFCALFPPLVERYDVRKFCAALALISASAYLVLSGASIATQRAFIMISLIFASVILGRPALTLHNVAIAALIVLILTPVSVLSASFQMSFAAVLALVSSYQFFRRFDLTGFLYAMPHGWKATLIRQMIFYASGLLVTSLIAGAVTGFIAIYHFNRFGNFGLIANLLAMPILGFWIMPAGLVALLSLLFGGLGFAMSAMGQGIEWVLALADYLTSQAGAVSYVAASPSWVLAFGGAGLVMLCVISGRWRLSGFVPILIATLGVGRADLPDVYILERAEMVAIRDGAGVLRFDRRGRDDYVRELWLREAGVSPKDPPLMDCDRQMCRQTSKSGIETILLRTKRKAVVELACAQGDVVISRYALPQNCAGFVPDIARAKPRHVLALFYEGQEIRAVNLGDGVYARRIWHAPFVD